MTERSDLAAGVPDGYATVTPWIIGPDSAGLLAFLAAAFAATEIARVHNDDGTIGHAEARIGDSVVMCFDARPDWPPTPAFLRLYVPDAAATHRAALGAGAVSVTEPTEMFWGDVVARVRDPFGNVWWLQQRLADLTPDEMQRRAARPEFVAAMEYVQGAEIVAPAG